METGDSTSLWARVTRLATSVAGIGGVCVLLIVLGLSLVGTPSAKASAGEIGTVIIVSQDRGGGEADACPGGDDASDVSHVGMHCSTPCGPQVGADAPLAALWRMRPSTERTFVVTTPVLSRTDAPEPFPPRISDHA